MTGQCSQCAFCKYLFEMFNILKVEEVYTFLTTETFSRLLFIVYCLLLITISMEEASVMT